MRSIKEVTVTGKRVLLRADLDGPVRRSVGRDGWESVDEVGLGAILPTIKLLVENGAKTIIIGHLDRPKGKFVEKWRLDPMARKLGDYLRPVNKIDDCVGPEVRRTVGSMANGDILLLENLRFHAGEEANDSKFAEELASLADIYVNDCFATSHRKHASIVGVPKFLPSYAGLRLMEETTLLQSMVKNPKRPLLFIIGGAKAETKVSLVRKLSKIADTILVGGTLMFEKSLEGVPKVRFPVDAVRVDDIGPRSIELFKKYISAAQTIVWNGPLGKFEEEKFAQGTKVIAEALLDSPVKITIGGGDTIDALKNFGLLEKFQKSPNVFLSTGGGAMLSFLARQQMPALEALGYEW